MNGIINIEYPEFLANSLKLNTKDFTNEMKTSALVKLFELGKISSGMAAKVLGLSRVDFIELLVKYKVSAFGQSTFEDINSDIANA
ncbi:MAG: UPF0175 family protein [Flavobacteriales bacterium]|nr:UPF0175 family protein [Flavobacteriales bacterium]